MKKKIMLGLMVAALLIGGLVSCTKPAAPEASYKIGLIVAQVGNYAGLGMQSTEGMQLIVDEINEGGGINGIPVELVIYDDKSEATEASLGAKKLIEVDKVHVLAAGTVTTITHSLMPVANELEVPLVGISGTAAFDDQLGAWGFKPMGSEADYILLNFDYLSEYLGVSKIANLIENSGYGQGGKIYIPQFCPEYGMSIVEEQYFDPGATDLTPQLTNIRNSEAEAIFVWGSSPTAGMSIKQARDMGITLPIVGTPTQLAPHMVEAFGQYYDMEPSFVAMTFKTDIWQQLPDSDPDKAMAREFAELFQEEYGYPPSVWSNLGATMAMFIEDGLRRANADPTKLEEARAKIRDAFENTNELQLLCGVYTMSPEDHFGMTRLIMVEVAFEDGRWVYLP